MTTMFQLKRISKDGIPNALQKAERYRLLNQPWLAESICSDVLEVEPGNEDAIVVLILAITDQFGINTAFDLNKARQLVNQLKDEYDRHYYQGIIAERQGIAALTMGRTNDPFSAYEWLVEAQSHYERAEGHRPQGNCDAILRWNTCARLIMDRHLEPRQEDLAELPLE
ncbi:hypothetical protein [Flavihumibacter solisilvae]|jgi:hypothetical protein|nr:hypothetical protein [Flavihumibacter solisilvae]